VTTINSEIKLDKINYTQENISSILKEDNIIDARKKLKFLLDAGLIGGDEFSSDSILHSMERNLINKNESMYHFALGTVYFDNAIDYHFEHSSSRIDSIVVLYTKAINEFLQSLELDPNNWEARANIGISYLNLGEGMPSNIYIEKAIEEYDKALEINPSLGWIHADKAYAYSLLNRIDKICYNAKKADSLGGLDYDRSERVSYYLENYCSDSY